MICVNCNTQRYSWYYTTEADNSQEIIIGSMTNVCCILDTLARAGEIMIDLFSIIPWALLTSQVSDIDGSIWPMYIPGLIFGHPIC